MDVKDSRKGTDGETGTGFGLIICSEIITKLNGTIKLESNEGRGTIVEKTNKQFNSKIIS